MTPPPTLTTNREGTSTMADSPICAVPDCGKPAKGARYCSGHEHRLARYGSPTGKPAPFVKQNCSIDGCGKPVYGRGFCRAHWKRFWKYGDPLAGGIVYRDAQRWVSEVALAYEGDECLTWPFGKAHGYGRINVRGTPMGASVHILERSVGPKPSPKHECCHRCGNGHLGCVNRHHLYWGTRLENVHDAIAHGTFKAPPPGARWG